jgi:hypothetical protein
MLPDRPEPDDPRTMVLEAFADTIVPGEKRWPGDRTIAGAVSGGGAVAAGAVTLLELPAGGFAPALDSLAFALDEHASAYAAERGLSVADDVPPFVALSFADRTALVTELTGPEHPEKQMWVGLAIFSTMAFDSAAHLSTPEAFATGHPGLLTIGYARPGVDRLYRFPAFSYGRQLARTHPATTATGSPA